MPNDETSSPEELARRRQWFDEYCRQLDEHSVVQGPEPGRRWQCPCCRFLTLSQRGGFEICPVCFWEDDGQDDHDAAVVRGGPNGALSLEQARKNYVAYGAYVKEQRSTCVLPFLMKGPEPANPQMKLTAFRHPQLIGT